MVVSGWVGTATSHNGMKDNNNNDNKTIVLSKSVKYKFIHTYLSNLSLKNCFIHYIYFFYKEETFHY